MKQMYLERRSTNWIKEAGIREAEQMVGKLLITNKQLNEKSFILIICKDGTRK